MERIRTRFAPSPTGHLHIGNARTAIMNWLFARHSGGAFVLRVEDTDLERSSHESEKSILKDLKWLGLSWDEGPDREGPFGPYRQSERFEIYQRYAEKLKESGQVYPCYCTPQELEERRKKLLDEGQSMVYDGRCRNLSSLEKKRLKSESPKPVLRFRADAEEVQFNDLVRGQVSFLGENIGDFVIMRADGMPMYNFSCVVDDHSMEISHVIRGDDHVSNTPRQVLLYEAFGWDPPVFAHIPMILGKDRNRLSKRHGATSVSQFKEQGYLSEALVNFLSLLSWSSESGQEILSSKKLVEEFTFERVSKSAAVFDTEKLDWMNGVYIRGLDPEKLSELILPFLQESGYPVSTSGDTKSITLLFREKIEKLSQIKEKAKILFQDDVEPEDDEAKSVLKKEESGTVLASFFKIIEDSRDMNRERFMEAMKEVQNTTGTKGKDLWMPVRIALTGQVHGPDLSGVAEFLGREKCLVRVQNTLNSMKCE